MSGSIRQREPTMLTPAGTECPHYYEDFHRGRSTQECRLIGPGPESGEWEPKLCSSCTVPAVLRANSCPNMIIQARVARRWLVLSPRVKIYAVCSKHLVPVDNPYVGCGHCHPGAASILDRPQVSE
ncbi:MAG: hypothetical protein E3J64_02845 [Anaerolineales bacterium]|nr:MAG: hypothetical protein E3J64_02845 [Anaerolineales bacterium]